MRYTILLACVALAACSQATASKIGDHTFAIQGPQIGGSSGTPDRRLADRLCPRGYRVLSEESERGNSTGYADRGANADSESGVVTNWTIRCL